MISLPDDISVHVFKGVKLMDIYDKTTGFPRLDNMLRNDGADRDGDFTANLKAVNLDEEWARNRNKDIELEIEKLREILSYNIIKVKPERVEKIEEEIENLLEERDDITFKYGLAGKKFERLYLEKKESVVGREFTDDELLDPKLLVREEDGADTDGDIIFSNGSRITRMGSEFDKSLMDSTIIQEANGDIRTRLVTIENRFRFITEEMFTLYSQKNADYGDAFTQSLDEDGLLVSKIRMKDKLNRFSQLINNDALVNDESMRDTLIDLANYTVMTLMWLDENE